jgi:thiamine kinase-like enzyme
LSAQSFNLNELGQAVAKVLSEQFATSVQVRQGQLLKEWNRNYVVRFRLEGGPVAGVVVKQAKHQEDTWYDEWAGLRFLTELAPGRFSPLLLGEDHQSAFFIMEDLGPGVSCEDYLNGSEPLATRQALLEQARLTAHLHLASLHHENRYNALRRHLAPPVQEPMRERQAKAFQAWVEVIQNLLTPFGLTVPVMEYQQVATIVANPGPLLVFTHGDLAPTNNHYGEGGVKLLDFEYGAYRHAFYDVISWQIICPYPADLIEEMNQLYRQELARAILPLRDEAVFQHQLLALCAFDLLRTLRSGLGLALQHSQQWATNFSNRQAILYKLAVFKSKAQEWGYFQELGHLSKQLHWLLATRWELSEDSKLPWPVFG